MSARGLVIGCGGTVGGAWSVGVLAAVERALAWDARDAAVIVGTSAGAELALCLGAGVAVSDLVAAQRGAPGADPILAAHFANPPRMFPPRPRLKLGATALLGLGLRRRVAPLTALAGLLPEGRGDARWLAALADHLVAAGAWVSHPATWMVGVDVASGERVAFGSPGAPAAAARDAVRASWAIPGWFPPVAIAGRRFADGGVLSPASADLVLAPGLDLDEIVVVAPMASARPVPPAGLLDRVERLSRRAMSGTLAAEVQALRAAGVQVACIVPDASDLAVLGPNFMDPRRRLAALERGLRTAAPRIAPIAA
jgi:NTE family protein